MTISDSLVTYLEGKGFINAESPRLMLGYGQKPHVTTFSVLKTIGESLLMKGKSEKLHVVWKQEFLINIHAG